MQSLEMILKTDFFNHFAINTQGLRLTADSAYSLGP